MVFFVFKALFTEFCNCACAKKIVLLIRLRHTRVQLIQKQAKKTISNLSIVKKVQNVSL